MYYIILYDIRPINMKRQTSRDGGIFVMVQEKLQEGKRRRRRPRRQWHDDIKDWFGVDIENAKRATDNRENYKLLVRAATSSRIRDTR